LYLLRLDPFPPTFKLAGQPAFDSIRSFQCLNCRAFLAGFYRSADVMVPC
jgi:hypothetical protein